MKIFSPNFAENVYGFKNMSVKNFVLILENQMAAIADNIFYNLKYCSLYQYICTKCIWLGELVWE